EVGELGAPGRPAKQARSLLRRILHWTGGHPYLTQRLCQAVAERRKDEDTRFAGTRRRKEGPGPIHPGPTPWAPPFILPPSEVDQLCEALFFAPRAQEREDNLLFVRERLLRSEADLADLLQLYQQLRRGRKTADDDTNSLVS